MKYVHRIAIDPGLPAGTALAISCGMYHIGNNSADPDDMAGYFENALKVAKIVCTRSIILDATPAQFNRAKECLFVLALRVFAGEYPPCPETIDDRHLRYLKLSTNGDCDDMAITACSFFKKMKDNQDLMLNRLEQLDDTDNANDLLRWARSTLVSQILRKQQTHNCYAGTSGA